MQEIITIIDSDDEQPNNLLTDYFKTTKKSVLNVKTFKVENTVDEQVKDKNENNKTSSESPKKDDNVFQYTMMHSPGDEDFFQEFESSDELENEQDQQETCSSDSDPDLYIPLSQRLAIRKGSVGCESSFSSAKEQQQKFENKQVINVEKSSKGDLSVIAIDEESYQSKCSSVVVDSNSSDSLLFMSESSNNKFTSLLEKRNEETKVEFFSVDQELLSVVGKKKRKSPSKTQANKEKAKATKEAKRIEKERRGAQREIKKLQTVDGGLKSCKAVIDNQLFQKYFKKGEISAVFEERGVYELTDEPLTNDCVIWKREVSKVVENAGEDNASSQISVEKNEVEEDHMIIVLDVSSIRNMVNAFLGIDSDSPTLVDFVKEAFDQYRKNLTIIIYGLESYYRKIINNENKKFRNGVFNNGQKQPNRRKRESLPPIKQDDVEEMLVWTQISMSHPDYSKFRATVRNVESSTDLAQMIFSYTKTIAAKPLKENRLEQQGYAWYVSADVKGSVDIKCPEDITKLWIQQLMQFPKISYDIANSIATQYPSVFSLASTYRAMKDKSTAEALLSSIKIVRKGEETNRKVGIELSKRVHNYMTSNDPEVLLNS